MLQIKQDEQLAKQLQFASCDYEGGHEMPSPVRSSKDYSF